MVGRTWARCVLGLLVFSAALFFTLLLAPLREGSSFILFVGATAVSSWLAGAAFGLAILRVVVSSPRKNSLEESDRFC